MSEPHDVEDVLTLIRADAWMMGALQTAQELELPDWWLAAGFVRNTVWDALHGYRERTPLADVDMIYFEPGQIDERQEKRYEVGLREANPTVPWSVKNQARMHLVRPDRLPYQSSADAVSYWIETPTCLGVRLTDSGKLELLAPHGVADLLALRVRPAPTVNSQDRYYYEKRVRDKRWQEKWPRLDIYHFPAELIFPPEAV